MQSTITHHFFLLLLTLDTGLKPELAFSDAQALSPSLKLSPSPPHSYFLTSIARQTCVPGLLLEMFAFLPSFSPYPLEAAEICTWPGLFFFQTLIKLWPSIFLSLFLNYFIKETNSNRKTPWLPRNRDYGLSDMGMRPLWFREISPIVGILP